MAQKRIVHLRVFRGKEINYDANAKVKNENQIVKITHDTREWENYMKNLKANGFIKVDVDKAVFLDGKEYKEVDENELKELQEEVDGRFNPSVKVELTADQKRIADLEAKLESLTGGKKTPKKESGNEVSDELKAEYEEVLGKKPYHGWDADKLREEIEKAKK